MTYEFGPVLQDIATARMDKIVTLWSFLPASGQIAIPPTQTQYRGSGSTAATATTTRRIQQSQGKSSKATLPTMSEKQ